MAPKPTVDVKKRLLKARTQLVLDEPFFGALALRLKLLEDPSCQTMWVDGVSLGYNPKFVAECTDEELKGTFCHEVLHVANGHCWRRNGRDSKSWNEACDYVINPIVVDAGFQLPPGTLMDPQFSGKSAEHVYEIVHQPKMDESGPPQGGASNGESGESSQSSPQGERGDASDDDADDDSASGDETDAQEDADADSNSDENSNVDDGNGDSEGDQDGESGAGSGESDDDDEQPDDGSSAGQGGEDAESDEDASPAPAGEVRDAPKDVDPKKLEANWRLAVDQAAKAAAMMGKLPGDLKRVVEEALKPSVDWRDVTRQFMQQAWAAVDYTWRRPSARYLAQGLYLPSLASETIPSMVAVIDTSGSIWGRMLSAFQGEVSAIAEEIKPEETHLVYCDAAVQRADRFEAGEPIVFEHVGGGGTDFRPVFSWIEKQGITPACVVYLTDLEGAFPTQPPDYPVLWVSPPTRCKPPWGDHVEMRI